MVSLGNSVRQFRRVIPTPDAPVLVEVEALGGLVLSASDISEGGMELQYSGSEPVSVGSMLSVAVRLPARTVIRTDVCVRHADPTCIGVAFDDLAPADCQAIRLYIYRNAAKRSIRNRLRQLWQT